VFACRLFLLWLACACHFACGNTGKYPRDLLSHALGEWLTDRVHAITSAVFVKVVIVSTTGLRS
jgi:hypothetical protein